MASIAIRSDMYLFPKMFAMACLLDTVYAPGRMLEPPGRASMWRFGFKTPKDYDDHVKNCGGLWTQYNDQNKGRCGVCGDQWIGVREHEPAGKYAKGIIVRKYEEGELINATIQLTGNHKGYFEFRLCPIDDPFERATQECLDKYLLKFAVYGEKPVDTRFPVRFHGNEKTFHFNVQLPQQTTCKGGLFQWIYTTGVNWGTNADGRSCTGCGNQEHYYACADIAIGHDELDVGKAFKKDPWIGKDPGWNYGNLTSSSCRVAPSSLGLVSSLVLLPLFGISY